jgi:glutamate-1-semialdehyde 2,1-aminomutase
LNALGDELRAKTRAGFSAAGVEAYLSGMGSLFRLHLGTKQVVDYRTAYADEQTAGTLRDIHRSMLDEGIILTPNCSGALSTPMSSEEIDFLATALVGVVARVTGSAS